ncbi:hypothetical protein K8352_12480 [Flavobacteriaceae bacterium F89]|uniref:Tetratricopeptide repeat protein n=1 Tax=Cerina litoralis TaxID=2874477 RepID=A0AAE3EWD4_9FLAO|nr:tetratricopeptide repeat protein [Cerina litoralis]MCG2461569.1 hypothetical protein [Cerina litoralis]
MKRLFVILIFFQLGSLMAQDDFLAKQYYEEGDFKKAVIFYERLVAKKPGRADYTEGLIGCYQQLERYNDARDFILKRLEDPNAQATLYVELGYNYTLQQQPVRASENYDEAISKIDQNPNYGYIIGLRFQKYALLDYAIKAYTRAMELNPQMDLNFQLARIYGELGDIEKMYRSYLTLLMDGGASQAVVLKNVGDFISSDPDNPNNLTFKKVLLRNAQQSPDLLWNQLLSWLFVQQNQFKSAFDQERAIYKRSDRVSLQRMEGLGELAVKAREYDTATKIFQFIGDNAHDGKTQLRTQLNLIDLALLDPDQKSLGEVERNFEALTATYGYQSATLQLQLDYASFLAFKMDKPGEAIDMLKECLDLPLNNYSKAHVKMELGDVLVYDQRFNEALIYFSQIQKDLKNDVMGQNARFKVAQTSFYKGDFDWALTQLRILRSSTSQLIANDAMQLSLLISDNMLEDSTYTALKKYARADLLAYQNKTWEAISELDLILTDHKGEKIEDEALLKQGHLLESVKDYKKAEYDYLKIVEFYPNGILADDAHFALAELYRNKMNEPQKAQEHYARIIYDYKDSYYFPQAQRYFRELRGDLVN